MQRSKSLFHRLPQEVFDMIAKRSPPNATKEAANQGAKRECADNILWRAIFATDEWLNLAERLLQESPYVKAPGPILIGKNLSSIGNPDVKDPKHHHILLAPNDWTGDLSYNLDVFFNSLREDYRYLEKGHKVILPRTTLALGPGHDLRVPGITLYIKNLMVSTETIELPKKELKRLFDKRAIRTQYTSSSLKKIQMIESSDVCGVKHRLSMPGDLSPICGLTFKTSIGPWQLLLRTPEADKWELHPMHQKEGPLSYVTGWTVIRKRRLQ
ncbi:uncharacterized protein N7483_002506 [Penicillium malachiteum]|uniref:uncharacterized protein n=1 Tax=Penicillium malachiteum TaxID=1324776 RepID=UPI00254783FC|nr:uncharacterized protein N7483_002393 [Penicillium malachiteum]XP_056952092.1 uncharacterized protein N7483_002506 [Penicillium malachiteum]KAJ5737268.1 hypothetical protein N7483_002393 [Penicillium malachiteum]KAJ5737381.1 hypothetical protein N7483_002506 [Penicillium malachiteum]